jgi:hypothetical protein
MYFVQEPKQVERDTEHIKCKYILSKPKGLVRLEQSGKSKDSNHLIGTRTRDLPAMLQHSAPSPPRIYKGHQIRISGRKWKRLLTSAISDQRWLTEHDRFRFERTAVKANRI